MGEFAQKSLAILLLLALTASHCIGADTAAVLVRTSGQVIVNGTPVSDSALLRANDVLETPQTTPVSLTLNGSSVILAPNTRYVVLDNAFAIDSGGTKVVTATGISAEVKAYTVSPKDPKVKTSFEVDWSGHSVYVYARVGDLKIHGPCEDWTLKEGKAVRIENPYGCKPGVWFYNDPIRTLVTAAEAAGTVGGIIGLEQISLGPSGPQNMSAEGP